MDQRMKCLIYNNTLTHANCAVCKDKIMFSKVETCTPCSCDDNNLTVTKVNDHGGGYYIVEYGKVKEYMYQ